MKNAHTMVVTVSPDDLGESYQQFTVDKKHGAGEVRAMGNLDILKQKKLALFCSVRCPGDIIIQAYDCIKVLRDAKITVMSGFHSPVEKECLKILLRGKQPIIVCPARSLENMRIRAELKKPLDDGRLLFLSPFQPGENRISSGRASVRNHFTAAVADAALVAYATPGGSLEKLCRVEFLHEKPVFVIENDRNKHLLQSKTRRVNSDTIQAEVSALAFSI